VRKKDIKMLCGSERLKGKRCLMTDAGSRIPIAIGMEVMVLSFWLNQKSEIINNKKV